MCGIYVIINFSFSESMVFENLINLIICEYGNYYLPKYWFKGFVENRPFCTWSRNPFGQRKTNPLEWTNETETDGLDIVNVSNLQRSDQFRGGLDRVRYSVNQLNDLCNQKRGIWVGVGKVLNCNCHSICAFGLNLCLTPDGKDFIP